MHLFFCGAIASVRFFWLLPSPSTSLGLPFANLHSRMAQESAWRALSEVCIDKRVYSEGKPSSPWDPCFVFLFLAEAEAFISGKETKEQLIRMNHVAFSKDRSIKHSGWNPRSKAEIYKEIFETMKTKGIEVQVADEPAVKVDLIQAVVARAKEWISAIGRLDSAWASLERTCTEPSVYNDSQWNSAFVDVAAGEARQLTCMADGVRQLRLDSFRYEGGVALQCFSAMAKRDILAELFEQGRISEPASGRINVDLVVAYLHGLSEKLGKWIDAMPLEHFDAKYARFRCDRCRECKVLLRIVPSVSCAVPGCGGTMRTSSVAGVAATFAQGPEPPHEVHEEERRDAHEGALVRIIGLKLAVEMNGVEATALRLTEGGDRWVVHLESGESAGLQKNVKPENLLVLFPKSSRAVDLEDGDGDETPVYVEEDEVLTDAEQAGDNPAVGQAYVKKQPRASPFMLANVRGANQKVARVEQEVPEPIVWDPKTSPVHSGIHPGLQYRQLCVHVYENMKKALDPNCKEPQVMFSPAYLKKLEERAHDSKKLKRKKRSSGSHRVRVLTAMVLGISEESLKRYVKAARAGAMRSPIARGSRQFGISSYMTRYAKVLLWAQNIERYVKKTGIALSYAGMAKEALKDKPLQDYWEAKLTEEERQVKAKADAEAAAELAAEKESLKKAVQNLIVRSPEEAGPDATEVGPESLLHALGMGAVEPEDKALRRVTYQLQRVLTRLGFQSEKLVREALDAMIAKPGWSAKFALKYYHFLSQPLSHLDDYWVMIDESWFHAGEAELRAIVSGGEAHAQAKGSNRRFGLIDAVILYWGKLPEAELAEHRDYYERASAQQDMWFVRDMCVLRVRKLRKTAHVWLAEKQQEKTTDKAPKNAVDQDGDHIGTMDWGLFSKSWYKPKLLDLLKIVKDAVDLEDLKSKWPGSGPGGALTEEDEADINTCCDLTGRTPLIVADGAGYHKVQNELWVQRSGVNGLYGVDGVGRTEEGVGTGWTKNRCIHWLWAHGLSSCQTIRAMEKHFDPDCGAATVDEQAKYDEYCEQSILKLRRDVEAQSTGRRFQIVEITIGEYNFEFEWTPVYIGKWLNIIEEMWHLTKCKGRVNVPVDGRNSIPKVKAGLLKELHDICNDHRQLQNTLLNSMRFCFGILKAVFHGQHINYKGKHVLFRELWESFYNFGCDIKRGDADENAEPDRAPRDIALREPPQLQRDDMPRGVHEIWTKTVIERRAGTIHDSVAEVRRLERTPIGPEDQEEKELAVGDWVVYWSESHLRHLHSHILAFNANGTLKLTVKDEARMCNVERGYRLNIPKKRKAAVPKGAPAIAKAKAAPEGGGGGGSGGGNSDESSSSWGSSGESGADDE